MEVVGQPITGGEGGQLRNRSMLKRLFDVDIIEVPKISYIRHILNLIMLRSYGHTHALWKTISKKLNGKYDFIFLDGSIYGTYVKYLNKHGHKTIVFFHNVEKEFCKQRYSLQKSIMNFALIYYVGYNEHLSVKYASKIVALNMRDSDGLNSFYNRKADLVLPIAHQVISKQDLLSDSPDSYLLFVGADFYANNEGILWFINNVVPFINKKVLIAGSCCNAIKKAIDISLYSNIELLGFVDDISVVYKNANCVICPIFSGSGTKTKTIEAMRYGKSIIGTTEAFVGINTDYNQIGALCNSADDFIKVINKKSFDAFNSYSYELFVHCFSTEANDPIFNDMVNRLINE